MSWLRSKFDKEPEEHPPKLHQNGGSGRFDYEDTPGKEDFRDYFTNKFHSDVKQSANEYFPNYGKKEVDADYLYRKSKEGFASFDIKDLAKGKDDENGISKLGGKKLEKNLDERPKDWRISSDDLGHEQSLERRNNKNEYEKSKNDRQNLLRDIESFADDSFQNDKRKVPEQRIRSMIEKLKLREDENAEDERNPLRERRKKSADKLKLSFEMDDEDERKASYRNPGKPDLDAFDIKIQKYERALRSPRRDSDAKRSSSKERDVVRKSSFKKSKDLEELESKKSGRDPEGKKSDWSSFGDPGGSRKKPWEDFQEVEHLKKVSKEKSYDRKKSSFTDQEMSLKKLNCGETGLPKDTGEKKLKKSSLDRRVKKPMKDENYDYVVCKKINVKDKVSDKFQDDCDNKIQFHGKSNGSVEEDFSKKYKKSERHSRPLTPPRSGEAGEEERGGIVDFLENDEKEFLGRKDWHESNRVFAEMYLRKHSKIHNRIGADDFHDDSSESLDEDEGGLNRNNGKEAFSKSERNGTTVIKIRSNGHENLRRRSKRKGLELEKRRKFGSYKDVENEKDDEEDDYDVDGDDEDYDDGFRKHSPKKFFSTPSRRTWVYREEGVRITDLEDGQPCLKCGDSCPGFSPHTWRKNCTSCKCPREAHDVCHEEWVSVRARLGLKSDETNGPFFFDPREKGYAWAPPGLPPHKVEEYFSMLPENFVPRLGTAGERHRDLQLAIQLPKQDLARAYCRHLDPQHSTSADDFMAARNEIALDIGSVQEIHERGLTCGACKEPLKYGSLAVSSRKLGLFYHPVCFQCTQCEELLVDLAYCVHDDTLYCERHYAEQLKPRCAACDELIFSGEYTKAMNKDWHSGHFCCWQCDESLTGQRYVLRDEHPYCIKCYESVFANGCEECNKIIGIDSKDLSYKDKHWHEACFLCNRCRVSLVDKQFGSKVDKIYCGNCYDAQFASRCDGCGEIFRAGTKKMEYKTRQWHELCFCCVVCKNPIGTKSFIPREQEIYCAGCYEDKFATRCVKCNKIITSGGVTYKNEPWHRDCFTCSNCNNSLAGQRFTSRDDKPYCADCFGELFAKRCTACRKPITGIGGTRFISFEDRHWHNDCFICAGCKTSLVSRGFITDGDDIICPECAKQKLM